MCEGLKNQNHFVLKLKVLRSHYFLSKYLPFKERVGFNNSNKFLPSGLAGPQHTETSRTTCRRHEERAAPACRLRPVPSGSEAAGRAPQPSTHISLLLQNQAEVEFSSLVLFPFVGHVRPQHCHCPSTQSWPKALLCTR